MELLEREIEVNALRELAAGSASGRGRCVVVAGGPGIGKTALLDHVRDLATERTLHAAGGELEDDVPFGVVRDLLRPLAHAIGRPPHGTAALAAPVFASASEIPDAGAVLHGLHRLVADAAACAPLTLLVDDVQWADPASVRFLAYLARRIANLPCLLVLGLRTGRDERSRPDVQTLVSGPAVRRFALAPLSPRAVSALVGRTLGAVVDPAFGDAYHAATGGNPLLCVEIAVELARSEVRGRAAERAAIEQLGAAGVAASVRHRVARHGMAAARLAIAVAVLGPSATYARARALADIPDHAADRALEGLVADGVLADARPLAFAHPILRAAVLDDLTVGARARWHAHAARLAAGEDQSELAAHHLRFAEPLGDPTAVALLRAAAERALGRGAPDVAAMFLERAAAEPPPAATRAAVLHELAVAAWHAGDGRAIELLRESRALATDPALRVQVAATLADAQMWAGRWQDAVATLEEGIAAGAGSDLTPLLGRLLRAANGSAAARRLAAERLATVRRRTAFGPGEHVTMGFLAVELAMTDGPARRAAELAGRALHDEAVLEHPVAGLPELLALALALTDERDAALRIADAALERACAGGRTGAAARIRALRAWASLRFGRPRDAERDARAALATEDGELAVRAARPLAIATMVLAVLDRAGPGPARAAADQFAGVAVDPDLVGDLPLALARAQLALAELRPDAALAALEVAKRWEEVSGIASVAFVSWRPLAVDALLLRDDRAAAAGLAAEQRALAATFGAPSSVGVALHAVARVERDAALLEEAVALLRIAPARTALVRALLDLGAMLRSERQFVRARAPLYDALDLAHAAGADALAARAREELAAAGARPRRERTRGIDALTPAERRACRLAAEGLTNRQIAQATFVSPRTVEMHLSNAYRKLEIAGRAQLRAVVSADAR